MENNSSYNIKNVAINVDGEIQRLGKQVDLFWEKELQLYKEAGLKDGMKVVELGCGPGYVLKRLLEAYSNITVKGVEIDSLLVEYANNMLNSTWGDRAEIQEGSILDINIEDNSFDFAIIRLVLEHLDDPKKAIKEVKRILKPNGVAVFIDNDFEMHIMASPDVPELRILYDAYCKCRADEGGNPKIGRELPLLLKQCDFENVCDKIISVNSAVVGDERFFGSEGMGIPMQLYKKGYLNSEDLSNILRNWKKMLTSPNHIITRMLFSAYGQNIGKDKEA